jgi:hypothetical protein
MATAVFGVASFGGFHAERLLFSPTRGAQPAFRDAQANEVLHDGIGTTLSESKIVFRGAAFVAVALDGDAHAGIFLEEVSILSDGGLGVGAKLCGIVIKVSVGNLLEEELVKGRGLGGLCDSGSASADCDADSGVGVSAGAGSGDGVCGGSGRCDRCGTLGDDGADLGSNGDIGGICSSPGKPGGFTRIDGGFVRRESGGGLDGGGRGSVDARRLADGFLIATGDNEGERATREQKGSENGAVRLNHSCPPRH